MQFWFCLGPRITSVRQARDFRSNTPLRFSGKGTIYEDEAEIFINEKMTDVIKACQHDCMTA